MKQERIARKKSKYTPTQQEYANTKERERMKEETTNQEKLLCPKAGTATSSPN